MSRYAWLALFPMPVVSGAEVNAPAPPTNSLSQVATAEVGGQFSFDLIRIDTQRFSYPLRFGNVKRHSETVELDGITLRRDVDYVIDYEAGTIMLRRQTREGQTLRVSYRYDPTKGRVGTFGATGSALTGMRLQFAPGASAMLSLGMTERTADGRVFTSNVYGLQNSFRLAPDATLTGLYAVSDRRRAESTSLMGDAQAANNRSEEGSDQAIVQTLQAQVLGGQVEVNYQDIGSDFTGFSAFAGSSFDEKAVDTMRRERGLTRTGFQLRNLGTQQLNFTNSFRKVEDDAGAIEWRSLGMQAGGLSLLWTGHSVDRGFKRFQDIREEDREALRREAGMSRESLAGAWQLPGAKLNFAGTKVEDESSQGITRTSLNLEAPWAKVGYSTQVVDPGFNRFNDLREGDRGQLAAERGIRRQNLTLESSALFGAPLRFANQEVRSQTGTFDALDFGTTGKNWSVEYLRRTADESFGNLGVLGPDVGQHVSAIARMVRHDGKPDQHDPHFFAGSAGLDRSMWRLQYDFGRGTQARFDTYRVDGSHDGATLQTFAFHTPRTQIDLRSQQMGDEFGRDLGRLLNSERNVLGSVGGLDRTDITVASQLDQNRSLRFSQSQADSPEGGFERQLFAFKDKGFEFNFNRRNVDPGFLSIARIVDPERDMLNTLVGFDQTEYSGKWQVMRDLMMRTHSTSSVQHGTGFVRNMNHSVVDYRLDSNTAFSLISTQNSFGPLGNLYHDQNYVRAAVSRTMGNLGRFTFVNEERVNEGKHDPEPSSVQRTVVYETQLNPKTAFRTEQSERRFETGDRDTLSRHTISTEIDRRTGISVTDTQIRRDGDRKDETHRDYGFWYDFGHGLRFTYGYARRLMGEDQGQLTSGVSLTPGQIGNLKIDQATYRRQGWDDQRNVHTGQFSIGTAKPMQVGPLRDLQFSYSADTARDLGIWQRERRSANFSTLVGGNTLGLSYLSIWHPAGSRAIDRTFRFATPKSDNARFHLDVMYKARTLPWDDHVSIRNFSLTARPLDNINLTHSLQTNLDQAHNDSILGTMPSDIRTRLWKLDFTGDQNTDWGLQWTETINDRQQTMVRSAKAVFSLFKESGSPVNLWYGLDQRDHQGRRQTAHSYGLRFIQRPGPNQSLSLVVSNLNWEHSRPNYQRPVDWKLQLDFSLRFNTR